MNRTFVMKAEELRIGNLISCHGKVIEVVGVVRNTIYHKGGFDSNMGEFYQPLKPIPLTEQWLIDFGFENNDFGNFEKTSVVIWFSSYSNCYVFRFGHQNEIPVKSVHQLQNLYFALTGEDLHL